jgi:hypothetical protein
MKRKKPVQPGLFDAQQFPLLYAPEQADDAPLNPNYPPQALGASVTLDGLPAKIIGRSSRYATIEPLDVDADPIRCCWDIVQDVLANGDGAFVRADDDTDE